jgi:hypothetical protein
MYTYVCIYEYIIKNILIYKINKLIKILLTRVVVFI